MEIPRWTQTSRWPDFDRELSLCFPGRPIGYDGLVDEPRPSTLDEQAAEPARIAKPDRPASEHAFTWWERAEIVAATWVGYLAVLLIGRTLRWQVFGREHYDALHSAGSPVMLAFWHSDIFSAIWAWRKRGIVVMVSQNFDGEYVTQIIRKHGYRVARGSSSRRASRVTVEMIREARKGRDIAVTPDGPRGPRHVAKAGLVLIAKAAAVPVLCFHIAAERSWTFSRSWDRTEIPRPFSRAALFVAPPIVVGAEASEEEQERKLAEVQATLDGLVERGRRWKESAGHGSV